VPRGELESWWRGGPANKNEWIIKALDKMGNDLSNFKEAKKFVEELCDHFKIA
jgi:hypothetical protein